MAPMSSKMIIAELDVCMLSDIACSRRCHGVPYTNIANAAAMAAEKSRAIWLLPFVTSLLNRWMDTDSISASTTIGNSATRGDTSRFGFCFRILSFMKLIKNYCKDIKRYKKSEIYAINCDFLHIFVVQYQGGAKLPTGGYSPRLPRQATACRGTESVKFRYRRS